MNNIEYRLKLIKSVVQYFFEYEWKDSNLILKSQIFYGNHHKLNKTQLIELAKYLDYIHSTGVYHGDIHLRNIFVKNINLEPGDTIIVPRKIITNNPGIDALLPITKILSDIAFSAAALESLSNSNK